MADLQQLTVNDVGDGWVDNVPGSNVATSYQAQNTNITARSLGLDLVTVRMNGSAVFVENNSGAIDINGVPFVMVAQKAYSSGSFQDGLNYFYIADTGIATEKNIQITNIVPTWNATKQYYETSVGQRVLNYVITKEDGKLTVDTIEPAFSVRNEERCGIGFGEERRFKKGTYSIPVKHSGIYSIGVIAGGDFLDENDDTTPGVNKAGGKGGNAVRIDLRLEAGQTIELNIGAFGNNSYIDVTNRLEAVAISGTGLNLINVIGDPAFDTGDFGGGTSIIYDFGSGFVCYGGGAGFYEHGDQGFIEDNLPGSIVRYRDGQSIIANYGRGGGPAGFTIGDGYGIIKWIGK